jgi:ADP-heptose:LPS heptosyltransferase
MTPESAKRAELWGHARRVLCVRLDNMGDVLMTTPALRALKTSSVHERSLTLLASSSGAAIAGHIPEVDAVLVYQAPWIKGSTKRASALDRRFLQGLAAARFEAAVIFTCYSQSALPAALLCALAGIPLTLAYCRENPYALLSDWVVEREPEAGVRHEVQRQLDLVGAVGASTRDMQLSFRLEPHDRATLSAKLKYLGAIGERVPEDRHKSYVVLHPGATAPSRRYAPHRFAHAARAVVRDLGLPVLVTGDASERALTQHIAASGGPGVTSIAGMLTVGELGVLIEGAALLIANNTGPVHLAAALGTPVVDLYALTNPQHTPWQVPHRVLNRDVPCRNCYKSVCPKGTGACLDVEPDEIVMAARALAHAADMRPHLNSLSN